MTVLEHAVVAQPKSELLHTEWANLALERLNEFCLEDEMARSKRHTPIFGTTTQQSEKSDKRWANRRLRRLVREAVSTNVLPDVLPALREVSNPWSMAKDGRTYWLDAGPRDLRK